MDYKIDIIKQNIETLSIIDLRSFIDTEIDTARNENSKVTPQTHIKFYFESIPQQVYFDRLVYFRHLTKDYNLSITDCKSKINLNYEKIKALDEELKKNDKNASSLFAKFFDTINSILNTLRNHQFFSQLDDEPLKQLAKALCEEKEITYQEVKTVLDSMNYAPRGIHRLSNSVFVMDGKYEEYLELKEKLNRIYEELSSEAFLNTRENQRNLLNERDKLYQNPTNIREQMINWRKAAMLSFEIHYTENELRTHSLLMQYD